MLFLSTLSLRRATEQSSSYSAYLEISIHALLAESDAKPRQTLRCISISIHALLAESDASTRIDTDNNFDFYPRSPCGERRPHSISSMILTHFYPRSPCGERRHLSKFDTSQRVFLSTLSLRRATSQQPPGTTRTTYFYPRSPCGERQESQPLSERPTTDFYPRSPCGERRISLTLIIGFLEFLSTLSLRRATAAGRFLLS